MPPASRIVRLDLVLLGSRGRGTGLLVRKSLLEDALVVVELIMEPFSVSSDLSDFTSTSRSLYFSFLSKEESLAVANDGDSLSEIALFNEL